MVYYNTINTANSNLEAGEYRSILRNGKRGFYCIEDGVDYQIEASLAHKFAIKKIEHISYANKYYCEMCDTINAGCGCKEEKQKDNLNLYYYVGDDQVSQQNNNGNEDHCGNPECTTCGPYDNHYNYDDYDDYDYAGCNDPDCESCFPDSEDGEHCGNPDCTTCGPYYDNNDNNNNNHESGCGDPQCSDCYSEPCPPEPCPPEPCPPEPPEPTNPCLTLVKTCDKSEYMLGETINYSFQISNCGDVELTNVMVTDNKANVMGGPITLGAGQVDSTSITATHVVTQADVDAKNLLNQATVSATHGNGISISSSSTHTAVIVEPVSQPCLSIEQECATEGPLTVGDVVEYIITVTNCGDTDIQNINLNDSINTVVGGPINLSAGQVDSTSFTMTYTITDQDVANGSVSNTLSASGNGIDGVVAVDVDDHVIDVVPPMVDCLEVTKGCFPAGPYSEGDVITYIFTVTNCGNTVLNNVMVNDDLLGSAGSAITLQPNEVNNSAFRILHTVTAQDEINGVINNTATAVAMGANGTQVSANDSHSAVIVSNDINCITIDKSCFPAGPYQVGDQISYVYTVTNCGNTTLSNVVVTDNIFNLTGTPITLAPSEANNSAYSYTHTVTAQDLQNGSISNVGTVTGVNNKGIQVSASDTHNATIVGSGVTGCVAIEKTCTPAGPYMVGDTITYQFTVTNCGTIPLTNVMVTDSLFPVSGGPISLQPNEMNNSAFTASHVVSTLDAQNGVINNTATVTAMDSEGQSVNAIDSHSAIIQINQNNCIEVVKDCFPAGPYREGQTITYTFTLTNCGNTTLTNVMVADNIVPVTGSPITLQPNEINNSAFTATHVVTAQDVANGSINNTATVTAINETGVQVSDTGSHTAITEITPVDCLELTKTCSPVGPYNVGETVTYIFTLNNCGNTTLTNVNVSDPQVVVVGSATTLAPNQMDNTSFTATHVVTEQDAINGSISNTAIATATSPTGTALQASDTHTLAVNTATNSCLEIIKDCFPAGPYVEGQTINYTFTITNCGNKPLTNVTVSDNLVPVTGSAITLQPNEINNSAFTATHVVTAQDVTNGAINNTAVVTATDADGQQIAASGAHTALINETPVNCIEIVKDCFPAGPYLEGQTINYTFTVTNCGNTALSNVIVTDSIVPVVGNAITLQPNEINNSSFTATHVVTAADVANGSINNTATVTAVGGSNQQVTASDSHSAIINITPVSCVEIVKDCTPAGPYLEGDVITYSFTVTNCGNTVLSNVVVTDNLVPVTGSAITLQPNEINNSSFTATHVVTAQDVANGSINNTATVTAMGDDGVQASASDTHSAIINVTPVSCVEIVKDCTPVGPYEVGQTINYTFTVTNCGNTVLSNVIVTDNLVPVVGSAIILQPNEINNSSFTATHVVTATDAANGSISNTATVTALGDDGAQVSASDNHVATINPVVNNCLSIVKDCTPAGPYLEGDTITYKFTVTNCGDSVINNVVVTDSLFPVTGSAITLQPSEVNNSAFTATHVVTATDVASGSINNTATVTGSAADGEFLSATGDHIALVNVTPVNCIEFTKTCFPTGPFNVGDTVNYIFTITNCGNTVLNNVTVTDNLIPVTGSAISLQPNEVNNSAYTASHVVTAADATNGTIDNTATVTASGSDGQIVSATDNHVVTINPVLTNCLTLDKTCSPEGPYQEGDVVTYNYLVTNCGTSTIDNITVTDNKLTVTGGPIFLAPNETSGTTFNAVYTITAQDVINGSVTNVADVVGFELNNNSNTVQATDTHVAVTEITPNPCVSIVKSCLNETAYEEGDVITYIYTIENCGNVPLTNVIVTDDKTPVSGAAITLQPSEVNNSAFTATYTVTAQDVVNGSVSNTATVTSNYDTATISDSDSHTASTSITEAPCLSLVKTADSTAPYKEGDVITYTYAVTNCGNVDVTNITIADDKVNVSGSIATLAVNQTDSTLTATHIVTAQDVIDGSITNNATATGTGPSGQDVIGSDSETVQTEAFLTPCISLNKTCQNTGPYRVGDTVAYQFTVSNCGQVTLENLQVTDPLLTVNGSIAALPAGQTNAISFSGTYVVTQEDVDNGSLTNTASVSATSQENGALVATDTSSHTIFTEVTPAPCLEIIKDCSPAGPYSLGQTINYTFTVTNCGNVPLTNVSVTDSLVSVNGPAIILQPSEVSTSNFTASYVVTQQDIENGTVDNTAITSGSFEGQTLTASDTHSAFMVDKVACIEVTKSCDTTSPYREGDTLVYNYAVRNCGNTIITNANVTDDKVAVTGGPTTLDPNELDSTTFTANYIVTAADVANGTITNTATATGMTVIGSVVDVDTHTATAEITPVPCISIEKSCSPVGPYEVGQTINYTYLVTNCGNVQLDGVTVTDDKVTVNGGPASLAPTQTSGGTFTASHVVTVADATAGSIVNTATAQVTYEGITYNDTAVHAAIINEACNADPLTSTCTVPAVNMAFDFPPESNTITTNQLACGSFGDSCTFNSPETSPLREVQANNNIMNIPIPAHQEGCILMLQVFGGTVSSTGLPVLVGTAGSTLTATELSNLNIGNSGSNIGSGDTTNGDIFQQVICLEGNGIEQGTVNVQLPDLDQASPADFVMYSWSQVCSSTCPMKKEYIKQVPITQGTNSASFTNTCNAIAFASGRNVGGYELPIIVDPIDPNDPSVTCLTGTCIEATCLEFKDPQCLTNNWLNGTGSNVYSYVSADVAVDNGGLGMIYFPSAGNQTINYTQNPTVSSSAGYTDDVIYTVFEFDLCGDTVSDVIYTDSCDNVITDPQDRCSYPINYTCSSTATITYNVDGDSTMTITPEINGSLDTSQQITLNGSGSATMDFTDTGTINQGQTGQCSVRYCVQLTGCSGTVNLPSWTTTMVAQ